MMNFWDELNRGYVYMIQIKFAEGFCPGCFHYHAKSNGQDKPNKTSELFVKAQSIYIQSSIGRASIDCTGV